MHRAATPLALLLPLLTLRDASAAANSTALREQYIRMVEWTVTGSINDEAGRCDQARSGDCSKLTKYDAKMRQEGTDWPPFAHTMIGHIRLHTVRMAIEAVMRDKVPGDFVELGSWRGGCGIYAKAIFFAYGELQRRVHLFDVFGPIAGYSWAGHFLEVPVAQVQHNFEKYGLFDDDVELHQGKFVDTLSDFYERHRKADSLRIAVLRIDSNSIDSHQDAFFYMYEFVPVGGWVLFDDVIAEKNLLKWWKSVCETQGICYELKGDTRGAWFQKTSVQLIDFTKAAPARDHNKGYEQALGHASGRAVRAATRARAAVN